MLYGKGIETDFVSSAEFKDASFTYATSGEVLPFIFGKNEAGTNYIVKYPNFCKSNNDTYPLFIARSINMSIDGYRGYLGEPCTYTTGNGDGNGIYPDTYDPAGRCLGYFYEPYISEFTHVCTNWYEFSKYKDNISANFCDKSSPNAGGISFGFTVHCLNSMNKDIFHRDDVKITDISDPEACEYWYKNAAISADFSNAECCPGYMGGMLLFKTDDAAFNNNKYIAVGFKGLYSNSWHKADTTSVYHDLGTPYEILDNKHEIHSNKRMYNYSFKLYKFDDTYFKRLSPGLFLFNDKELLPIGVPNVMSNLDYCTKFMAFNGPFMSTLTGAMYNGTDSDNTFYITSDDCIVPTLLTSFAYMTEEPMENCISAKSPTTFTINGPVLSVGGLDGVNGSYNTYVNFYYSSNRTSNKAYLTTHPVKSCKYTDGVYIRTPVSNIYFGKCLSGFNFINVGWMNMSAFEGIEGNNWDNWYNITDCGSINCWVFYNAYKLKQIPPTWNGLGKVNYARAMFKGCSALESLPNSWVGLNSLTSAYSMFKGCSKLESLPNSWEGLETLQYGDTMFSGCKSLKTIPMTPEAWSHLKNATTTKMFDGCTGLTFDGFEFIDNVVKSQECQNCKFAKVTNYTEHGGMFYGCTNIVHYDELTAGTNSAYKQYESFFK